MEQKKVQRIIGIIVVIALVIVVMPFLFGKNNFPLKEAATVKAPPFPDQQQAPPASVDTQTLAAASGISPDAQNNSVTPQAATDSQNNSAAVQAMADSQNNAAISQAPVTDSQNNSAAKAGVNTEQATADKNANNTVLPEPSALSQQIQPASTDNKAITAPSGNSETTTTSADPSTSQTAADNKASPANGSIIYEPVTAPTAEVQPTTAEKPTFPEMKSADTVVKESEAALAAKNETPPAPVAKVKKIHLTAVKKIQTKVKTITLNKAASPEWVVQLGNFAVKSNAIHLSDKLRAAGYHVFTHEIKSSKGVIYTRVYIGPESKQASAVKLVNEIHQKLNLSGFVASYKPSVKIHENVSTYI